MSKGQDIAIRVIRVAEVAGTALDVEEIRTTQAFGEVKRKAVGDVDDVDTAVAFEADGAITKTDLSVVQIESGEVSAYSGQKIFGDSIEHYEPIQ